MAIVLVAIHLDQTGFSLAQTGLFLSLGFAGGAFLSLIAGLAADTVGRRRMLTLFAALAATSGLALGSTEVFALLALAAFVGAFGTSGGGSGPLLTLDQAILPGTCPPERRTDVFAAYGIAGMAGTSLGALAAGLPSVLESAFDFDTTSAFRVLFYGQAGINVAVAFLYSRLSAEAEIRGEERGWVNPLKLPSRGMILKITGLFGVDAFAGGFIVQSLVSFWFFTHFGIETGSLGLIFFASNVLSGVSLWVAARLAARFGLINTIVFSHIPSSILLIAVPFLPFAWMAVLFWLVRACFTMMDVPTRQSYIMAVVSPRERMAMASATTLGRSASIAASPPIATALWTAASASVPFIISGVLKIAYDLALWVMFRGVRPPEEADETAGAATGSVDPPSTAS